MVRRLAKDISHFDKKPPLKSVRMQTAANFLKQHVEALIKECVLFSRVPLAADLVDEMRPQMIFGHKSIQGFNNANMPMEMVP